MSGKAFNRWKTVATARIIYLLQKTEKPDVVKDLEGLLRRLRYLRSRDLGRFMVCLYDVISRHRLDELREIIPCGAEVEEMLKSMEKDGGERLK